MGTLANAEYCAASQDHDSVSGSGSNFSTAILPSAFFNKISTRPSASSSCFWHSRESATPSSNNFIASSRDSCGLSSRRTTSSRRCRDFSKSGFLGGSGFLMGTEFTRSGLVCAKFCQRTHIVCCNQHSTVRQRIETIALWELRSITHLEFELSFRIERRGPGNVENQEATQRPFPKATCFNHSLEKSWQSLRFREVLGYQPPQSFIR